MNLPTPSRSPTTWPSRWPSCAFASAGAADRAGRTSSARETRVELLFDVAHSPSLTDDQRGRILQRLAGYIDDEGELRIVSSATRSQLENRAAAITRFQMLMAAALRRRKHRVPTRPSAARAKRRLTAKKGRAEVKSTRRKVGGREYE